LDYVCNHIGEDKLDHELEKYFVVEDGDLDLI
jgi:hypothetical protein